jgi:tetratricopeptide (TPR) repeat protein
MNRHIQRECIDMELGQHLPLFELGLLKPEDQERFEQHLMECEFCRSELEKHRGLTPSIARHREELISYLHELEASERAEKTSADDSPRSGFTWRKSYLWAPVLAAAAVLLFFLWPNGGGVSGKYLGLLSFEKLEYQKFDARDLSSGEVKAQFDFAMDAYLRGDYASCAQGLVKVLKQEPTHERAHVYLGVCYYLLKEPRRAVAELEAAFALPNPRFLSEIRWYLAQSYLLTGEKGKALPLLMELSSTDRRYAVEAATLLANLR